MMARVICFLGLLYGAASIAAECDVNWEEVVPRGFCHCQGAIVSQGIAVAGNIYGSDYQCLDENHCTPIYVCKKFGASFKKNLHIRIEN